MTADIDRALVHLAWATLIIRELDLLRSELLAIEATT